MMSKPFKRSYLRRSVESAVGLAGCAAASVGLAGCRDVAPEARLEGRVVSGDAPVAGAIVELSRPHPGGWTITDTADAEGRFELVTDRLGGAVVRIHAPGFGEASAPVVLAASDRVRLAVEPAAVPNGAAAAGTMTGGSGSDPTSAADGRGAAAALDGSLTPAAVGVSFIGSGEEPSRRARLSELSRRVAAAPAEPSEIEAETDPSLRAVMLVDRLRRARLGAELEPDLARQALREVPPASPLWSFRPDWLQVVRAAVEHSNGDATGPRRLEQNPGLLEQYLGYLDVVADTHGDPSVRAAALFHAMQDSYRAQMDGLASMYLQRLVVQHPGSGWAEDAKRAPDPNARIAPGLDAPTFSMPRLDRPEESWTNDDLAGKITLIDFWATWCGPCIAELDNLHEVYERYRDRGFEILSVNVGEPAELIEMFRAERYTMPWLHARIDVDSELMELFEIPGLPRTVLVGADGVILEARLGPLEDDLPEFIEAALAAREPRSADGGS